MVEKIYRIKSIYHSRTVDEWRQTDEGYCKEVCIGEAGLEAFSKTHNIANVERNEAGHIVRCTQKEYTMSGGYEGCFFEFIPEEAEVLSSDENVSEPCEDAISRKQALEALEWVDLEEGYDYEKVEDMLNSLPPVTPTRKKGKWINCKGVCECSICHKLSGFYVTNYCPNCGCCMTESED